MQKKTLLIDKKTNRFSVKLSDFTLIIALLLLILLFYFLEPRFLSQRNIYNIILQVSVLAPVAIGMTLVILIGGIDLSVGSVLAFSQAYCANLVLTGTNSFLAIGMACLIGLVLGAINGFLIAYVKLPPFVATLGMMSIARGFQMTFTLGATLYSFPEDFRYIGTEYWFGVPIPIYLTIFIFVLFFLIMKYTTFGRSVYAIGGNEQAARISGISVARTVLLVFVISGILTALAGVLQLMRLNAHETSAGQGLEMEAIASVVIGGTSMAGGRGSVLKTAIGTLVYGVIINGLNIVGVNPFIQKSIIGILIIAAVTIDVVVGKFRKN
ncbi:MAG: ABC transporter permease [Saccharofermentanales bacterium]|jgi:ribose transport system permease protein